MNYYGLSENSRANGSCYGGITGYRVAEGATITASGPQIFYRVHTQAEEYAAVAYLTDEVLNDARMLEQELQTGIVGELSFMVNDDMFRGAGVAGCYGILNHPSLITVSKEAGQAADTVVWKNILKMWNRRYALRILRLVHQPGSRGAVGPIVSGCWYCRHPAELHQL